jgi:hypothetical protein
MNQPPLSQDPSSATGPQDSMSVRFENMVVQHTNMTLMLLGRMPHPESGQTFRDIEGAKLLIDQLEMLEFKTRGNLDAREDKLLKQSLTSLRMAFVDAIDRRADEPAPPPSSAPAQEARPADTTAATPPSAPEDESRKKFTKKY